jgi:hypothetical protein
MTAAEPERGLFFAQPRAGGFPLGHSSITAQREKGRHDEVAPRGRADPPADEVQSVSLLCRLTRRKLNSSLRGAEGDVAISGGEDSVATRLLRCARNDSIAPDLHFISCGSVTPVGAYMRFVDNFAKTC